MSFSSWVFSWAPCLPPHICLHSAPQPCSAPLHPPTTWNLVWHTHSGPCLLPASSSHCNFRSASVSALSPRASRPPCTSVSLHLTSLLICLQDVHVSIQSLPLKPPLDCPRSLCFSICTLTHCVHYSVNWLSNHMATVDGIFLSQLPSVSLRARTS